MPKKKLFKKHYTLSWKINTQGVEEVVQIHLELYAIRWRVYVEWRIALVLTEMFDVSDSTK